MRSLLILKLAFSLVVFLGCRDREVMKPSLFKANTRLISSSLVSPCSEEASPNCHRFQLELELYDITEHQVIRDHLFKVELQSSRLASVPSLEVRTNQSGALHFEFDLILSPYDIQDLHEVGVTLQSDHYGLSFTVLSLQLTRTNSPLVELKAVSTLDGLLQLDQEPKRDYFALPIKVLTLSQEPQANGSFLMMVGTEIELRDQKSNLLLKEEKVQLQQAGIKGVETLTTDLQGRIFPTFNISYSPFEHERYYQVELSLNVENSLFIQNEPLILVFHFEEQSRNPLTYYVNGLNYDQWEKWELKYRLQLPDKEQHLIIRDLNIRSRAESGPPFELRFLNALTRQSFQGFEEVPLNEIHLQGKLLLLESPTNNTILYQTRIEGMTDPTGSILIDLPNLPSLEPMAKGVLALQLSSFPQILTGYFCFRIGDPHIIRLSRKEAQDWLGAAIMDLNEPRQ